MSQIAVVGSGAWGTALAISLARRGGHTVALWSHSSRVAEAIHSGRENTFYLPGYKVAPAILVSTELSSVLSGADLVISVVPSMHVREIYSAMAPSLKPCQVLISATKGVEDQSCLRMTQLIAEVLSSTGLSLSCAVLSGPSFAQEVAAGFPTAITLACNESKLANHLQEEFTSPTLRLYTNDDVIGVELGGALKNVIAIAAGIAAGLGLGHNSVAAIVTRGIAEITRLAVACGGRRETLAGLSGLGDLVLTCTGPLSRNRTVGMGLGRGEQLPVILAQLHGRVAEGVRTTSAALSLARVHGIEMPIAAQMFEILHHGRSPQDAIRELMARPGRDE